MARNRIPTRQFTERDRVVSRIQQNAAYRTYDENVAIAAADEINNLSERGAGILADFMLADAAFRGEALVCKNTLPGAR